MDVRNCKGCGKLFNYLSGIPLCPECLKKLEEKFIDVKQYIEDHPGASLSEIAEDNDVTVNQIKRWVREERLSFTADSVVGLECENCGTIIKTGRFCDSCKEKLQHGFEQCIKVDTPKIDTKKLQRDSSARMRFLDGK